MTAFFETESSDDFNAAADAAYDELRERVDAGEECPTCHARPLYGAVIEREINLGIPAFHCVTCECRFFDWATIANRDGEFINRFAMPVRT